MEDPRTVSWPDNRVTDSLSLRDPPATDLPGTRSRVAENERSRTVDRSLSSWILIEKLRRIVADGRMSRY